MTDREKLCELICEGTNHDCVKHCNLTSTSKCYSCTSLADHLIANGVTFATDTNVGGKWIPVTERLPDVWMDVLTNRTGGDLSIEFKCSGDGWAFDNDMPGEVTHWMPLPEPPKED